VRGNVVAISMLLKYSLTYLPDARTETPGNSFAGEAKNGEL